MDKKVKVVSLVSQRVVLTVPDLRLRRVWERKGAVAVIPFEQLEEAMYQIILTLNSQEKNKFMMMMKILKIKEQMIILKKEKRTKKYLKKEKEEKVKKGKKKIIKKK